MGIVFGRRPARALAAATGLAVLVAGGCGVETDDGPRAIPRDNLPERLLEEPTQSSATTDPAGAESVTVYFLRTRGTDVRLEPVWRSVADPASERSVLDALLLEVPRPEERADGISTAIPSGTVQVDQPALEDGGVLVVDLSQGLFQVQSDSLRNAYAQIVCTATAHDPVDSVLFNVEGQPVSALGGDSQAVDRPLRCSDYADLMPSEVDPAAAPTPPPGTPPTTPDPAPPAVTTEPAPPPATDPAPTRVPGTTTSTVSPSPPAFEPAAPEVAL